MLSIFYLQNILYNKNRIRVKRLFMSNFFEDIFGSAIDVYIAISTTNRMEIGVLDPHTKLIKTYAETSLEYNEATREIADYDIFRAKLEKLFEENDLLSAKCNIHISLPTVWFGYKDNIPISSSDENIKNIVFSELDQTYIFKRTDPVPCWFDAPPSLDTESKSVFYTAVQADVVETLRNIFKEMGTNLIEVTSSFSSDLKGLLSYGYAEEQMNMMEYWNLMVINNSGFQLYGFKGKQLADYYEEPLPIKSLEEDEIYSTIDNAAQIALMGSAAQSLIIISETDSVSAQEFAKRIQFGGSIKIIEDNNFRKKPFCDITQSLIPEVQPEVSFHLLGMFPPPSVIPMSVNFLLNIEGFARNDIIEIPISNDKTIVITKPKAMIYSLALLIMLGLPLMVGVVGSYVLNQKLTNKIEELDTEIKDVTEQLKKYENKDSSDFDPYKEIEKVVKNNRKKIIMYSSLGESVPKNLYLTYFMTGNDAYVDVQGYANTVEDVYIFFQNLKDSMVDSKLRLSKLDLQTSSLEDIIQGTADYTNAPYIFEITNMDEGQLSSFMNALRGSNDNDDGNGDKKDNPKGNNSNNNNNVNRGK